MKATINFLWDTDREIISFDDSEFNRPTTFAELKKCNNVIIGEKIDNNPRRKDRYVMIDDSIYLVTPVKLQHPSGGGSMYALEIN